MSCRAGEVDMEEKLGAHGSTHRAMEDPARRAGVPAWEEEEFCVDNLDGLNWRRVYNASNPHWSL